MSPSKVRLEVTSADPATELFVIDGDFKLAGRGIGSAVFEVDPGIYKVKARAGVQQEERLVIVRSDEKVVFEPLSLASPIPLLHTAGTTEEQIVAAEKAVSHVDATFGNGGSSILIMVLGPEKKLRLRAMNGTTLAETIPSPWHAELEPGGYRLDIELPDGRIVEQSLVTAPGWQTRVFIPENLGHIAISMRAAGTPYDRNCSDARLEEMARQALVFGRNVLSDEIRQRLASPAVPPILGILGMHLLIREAKENKEQREHNPDAPAEEKSNIEDVKTIIANLRAAIGKHPDVEAIAIGAGVADPDYPFDVPPMLTLSWRLLLKATADQRKDLMPSGSFFYQIGVRLWGDGVWLQWLDPETDRTDREAAWQDNAKRILAYLDESSRTGPHTYVSSVQTGEEEEPAAFDFRQWLGPLERFIKKNPKLEPVGELMKESMVAKTFDLANATKQLDAARKRKLVKQLGVPLAAIDDWLASLEKK